MKPFILKFGAAVVALLSWWPLNVKGDLEIGASFSITSEADFYEPLTPHGGWVEVDTLGRCWRPSRVAVEWEPYCEGHWVWTDCGWYWESDEPWAWACYHYGRWYYHPTHHWIWIPGREWAPAWVTWRTGGGYIGWAPMAPVSVGITIAPSRFVFVETRRFHQPIRRNTVIVNNTTIINNTTVINNNIRTETRNIAGVGERRVNVNNGPGVDVVQKETRQTFQPTPVREVAQKTFAAAPAEFVRRQTERAPNRQHDQRENRNVQPAPTPTTPTQPVQPSTPRPEAPRPENPRREEPRSQQPRRETPEAPKPVPPRRETPEAPRPVVPRTERPEAPKPVPPRNEPVPPRKEPVPPRIEERRDIERESPRNVNPPQPVPPAQPAVPPREVQPRPEQPRNVQPAPQRPGPDYRQPRDNSRGRGESRGREENPGKGKGRDKDRPDQ